MSAWDYALVNSRNAPLLREFERYGYASGLIRFQVRSTFPSSSTMKRVGRLGTDHKSDSRWNSVRDTCLATALGIRRSRVFCPSPGTPFRQKDAVCVPTFKKLHSNVRR